MDYFRVVRSLGNDHLSRIGWYAVRRVRLRAEHNAIFQEPGLDVLSRCADKRGQTWQGDKSSWQYKAILE
jgi:hypothetical protein